MEQALESLGLEAARSNKPGMTVYEKPGFIVRWLNIEYNTIDEILKILILNL